MSVLVAVNEAILLRGTSGSARVAQQMIAAISEMDGVAVKGVRPTAARSRSRIQNAVRDAWWDLRGAARSAPDADLLLSPCNVGRAPKRQPHLLVVHDVMVWESGHLFDPSFAAYARHLIRFSVQRADRVVTPSKHARDFLLDLVPTSDVRVLRLPAGQAAVGPVKHPPASLIVLMVGETAAHKNQVAGIEAVEHLRARTGVDVRLRVIGPPGRAETEVRSALTRADPRGRWATRETELTDGEMHDAYATAWALLQPSLNEGYGLPLVEAARWGLPVIHSGAGAMSEVLPDCSVASTASWAFTRRLQELLERAPWEAASAHVLARADAFSWGRFSTELAQHVRDLGRQP